MSLIAGLRERRERGALSIELSSSQTRVQVLETAALAMLDCVQALVLDIDEIGAPALRESLATLRGRIQAGGDSEQVAQDLTATRREALEFAEAERDHLERRDAELHRIIQVLSDGIAGMTRGAAAYQRQVLDSGARFEAAARLSDLVRMRTAITTEVQSLRKAVAEQQAADTRVTAALRAEVEQLRTNVERANTAARTDALTQAMNRAGFDEELARRCTLAASGGGGFALLLVDIDHFKQINDAYGHQVGDRVLHALVMFLRDRVRRGDTIARWGGEEFVVLLPDASVRAAFGKAKALVSELASSDWTIEQGRSLRFTASVGVTAWRTDDEPATVVARADQALYAAKRSGRNRAVKSAG